MLCINIRRDQALNERIRCYNESVVLNYMFLVQSPQEHQEQYNLHNLIM